MSTVRKTNTDRTYGYGVDGISVPISDRRYIFALEDYIADIPLNLSPVNGTDIGRFLLSMRWRTRIQITNAGFFSQKIFNTFLGRGIFGEYAVGARQYFSDHGFVSFPTFISDLYYTQFMFEVKPDIEEMIPCDEPPVDLDFTATLDIPAINAPSTAAIGGRNVLPSFNEGARKPTKIGSNFIFTSSYPDMQYIAGITYEYTVMYYTEDIVLDYDPVTIGL